MFGIFLRGISSPNHMKYWNMPQNLAGMDWILAGIAYRRLGSLNRPFWIFWYLIISQTMWSEPKEVEVSLWRNIGRRTLGDWSNKIGWERRMDFTRRGVTKQWDFTQNLMWYEAQKWEYIPTKLGTPVAKQSTSGSPFCDQPSFNFCRGE